MFTSFLFASAIAASVTPVKIEVAVMQNGKVAKPVAILSAQDQKCSLTLVIPKKEVKISEKACQDFLEKNKANLEVPVVPSDLLSSKVSFYEVKVTANGKTWTRLVQQNQNALCTAAGKCHTPEKPSAWKLAQALQGLLNAK